jgi:transcription-repair coupling factor (superfamily II helicase)
MRKQREFKGMTQSDACLMKRVLDATYARLDDFSVETKWTVGGYVIDIIIDYVKKPVRLATIDDCIDEIARWND